MTTPSHQFVSVAGESLEVQDKQGRTLRVRRLNALDHLRLLKAAGPELSQNDAWLNVAALALAVSDIDGIPRIAATNERQIEALVSDLGDLGLQAVSEAVLKLETDSSLFEGSPEGNVAGTPF